MMTRRREEAGGNAAETLDREGKSSRYQTSVLGSITGEHRPSRGLTKSVLVWT